MLHNLTENAMIYSEYACQHSWAPSLCFRAEILYEKPAQWKYFSVVFRQIGTHHNISSCIFLHFGCIYTIISLRSEMADYARPQIKGD